MNKETLPPIEVILLPAFANSSYHECYINIPTSDFKVYSDGDHTKIAFRADKTRFNPFELRKG